MSKKSTQIETEEKILNKCKEKNYTLIEPFIYTDANKTLLILSCNIDGYKWKSTYNQFINQNKGCKKCAGILKKTQSEAEVIVLNKCKEKNYTLIEPFTYTNTKKTILYLKCNKDNHEWNITYNNFINKNRNCSKCTKKYKPTQKEAEELVLNKCKEKNYTLIESFVYNGAKTILHVRCNKDNYKWYTTYNNFINNNRGCKKCSGRLKITQIEAEELVLNKCKEKNYTLFESFIYNNNTTKLHLKCNIDNHEWFPTYNSFIKCDKGCPICNDSHGESIINRILTEKNITFKREYKFENCKYKKLLQFDFYLPEHNICIEYDGVQHFESIEKWGGEKTLKDTQIRDGIKTKYCLENNIKLIRIRYNENIFNVLNNIFNLKHEIKF
jgi:very-short-patch-repair endonuclease